MQSGGLESAGTHARGMKHHMDMDMVLLRMHASVGASRGLRFCLGCCCMSMSMSVHVHVRVQVYTGFRVAPGGAQQVYDVKADMVRHRPDAVLTMTILIAALLACDCTDFGCTHFDFACYDCKYCDFAN